MIGIMSELSTYHDFIFILDVSEADFSNFMFLLRWQPVIEHLDDEGVLVLRYEVLRRCVGLQALWQLQAFRLLHRPLVWSLSRRLLLFFGLSVTAECHDTLGALAQNFEHLNRLYFIDGQEIVLGRIAIVDFVADLIYRRSLLVQTALVVAKTVILGLVIRPYIVYTSLRQGLFGFLKSRLHLGLYQRLSLFAWYIL